MDYVAVLSFTAELATYSAERFVQEVLRDRFLMRELLVGHDHGFGRGREAGAEALLAIGARDGFAVEVVPAVADAAGEAISSSGIRRAITQGALDAAAAALGRRYGFAGRVVAGKGRGRTLGVPTLNVALDDHRKLLPPDGVYAVRAQTLHGTFGGMMNLGSRPTFGDESRALEVHLFDADGDWYGTRARVDFVAWLRPTRRFADAQELKAQLSRDAADAHDHLRRAAMTDTDLALTQVPV